MQSFCLPTLLLLAATAARADDAAVRKDLDAAAAKAQARQFADADLGYVAAIGGARNLPTPALLHDALVRRAENLAAWQEFQATAAKPNPTLDARIAADSVTAYTDILEEPGLKGSDDWLTAGNNLGLLYLDLDKGKGATTRALGAFAQVVPADLSGLKGEGAAVVLANYAMALERADKPAEALGRYRDSLTRNPGFARPAREAVRLLNGMPAGPARRAAAEAVLNVPGLPPATLGTMTHDLIFAWAGTPDVEAVVPFLVAYYARLPVTADRLRAGPGGKGEGGRRRVEAPGEADRVKRLKEVPALATRIIDLEAIYTIPEMLAGPGENDTNPWRVLGAWKSRFGPEPFERYRPETPEQVRTAPFRHDFARLLKVAGDGFRAAADRAEGPARVKAGRAAVGRYTAAFALDNTSLDAARAAVGTLADHRAALDENGRWLDDFARDLFEVKTGLRVTANTRAQFTQLISLHILLAQIYESKEKWGPDRDVFTAAYHWRTALEEEDRLRGIDVGGRKACPDPDRDYPRSPFLVYRLAEAYRKDRQNARAVARYREAAGLYLDVGNLGRPEADGEPTGAAGVLHAVKDLAAKGQLQITEKDQFAALEEVVRRTSGFGVEWETVRPSPVRSLAFAKDDLVVGSTDLAEVWAVGAKAPKASWNTLGSRVAVTQDAVVGTAGADEYATLLVRDPFRPTFVLGRHERGIKDLVGASRGTLVASLGTRGDLKLWDTMKRDEVRFGADWMREGVTGAGLSGDGGIVFGTASGRVNVYSLKADRPLPGLSVENTAAALSTDGDWLAVARKAMTNRKYPIELYEVGAVEPTRVLTGHPGPVRAIQYLPDGARLVTLGTDHAVRLWHVTTGMELARFGFPRPPTDIAVSADGTRLAIAAPAADGSLIQVRRLAPGK